MIVNKWPPVVQPPTETAVQFLDRHNIDIIIEPHKDVQYDYFKYKAFLKHKSDYFIIFRRTLYGINRKSAFEELLDSLKYQNNIKVYPFGYNLFIHKTIELPKEFLPPSKEELDVFEGI